MGSIIRLIVIAGVILVGLVGALFTYINEKINYREANARITEIISDCIMEKKQGKTTHYSEKIPCFVAEEAVKSSSKWLGHDVKYNYKLKLLYISPTNNKTYSQILDADKEINEKNKYKVNDTFRILVDKSNPEEIKKPLW